MVKYDCLLFLDLYLFAEEFNRKMLTPDVNKQDLENLYKEAWDLFSVYFSLESPDRIHFSQQVISEMHAGIPLLSLSQTQHKDHPVCSTVLLTRPCNCPQALPVQCFSTGVTQHFELKFNFCVFISGSQSVVSALFHHLMGLCCCCFVKLLIFFLCSEEYVA